MCSAKILPHLEMVLREESSIFEDTPRVLIGITNMAMRDMNTMTEVAVIPLLLGGIDNTAIGTILVPEETTAAAVAVAAGAGAVREAVCLRKKDLQVGACQARKL